MYIVFFPKLDENWLYLRISVTQCGIKIESCNTASEAIWKFMLPFMLRWIMHTTLRSFGGQSGLDMVADRRWPVVTAYHSGYLQALKLPSQLEATPNPACQAEWLDFRRGKSSHSVYCQNHYTLTDASDISLTRSRVLNQPNGWIGYTIFAILRLPFCCLECFSITVHRRHSNHWN